MSQATAISPSAIVKYFDEFDLLDLKILFLFGSVDDQEGGYVKLKAIKKWVCTSDHDQVDACLDKLMDLDLVEYATDLVDSERQPWGSGYIRSVGGDQLVDAYLLLEEASSWVDAKAAERQR